MRRVEPRPRGAVAWLVAALALGACGGRADEPTAPIEELLRAVKSGDAGALARVCDPAGGLDGDARRVCGASPADAAVWAQVGRWFGEARIVGLAIVGEREAVVEVEMGPDRRRVPMTVVGREGRWYLQRF